MINNYLQRRKLRPILTFCFLSFILATYDAKGSDLDEPIKSLHPNQSVITGTVYDGESNDPMLGATILEEGTNHGTTTNFDGEFSIRVEKGATLVISFVGYKSKKILIGDQTDIKVTLELDQSLEETVVIGFNTNQKKASLVSSITSINPAELKGPTSNLTTMLAGRVAGMIAFQRSGEPGADNSNFFIRGLGTFGAGKRNPLILIDGIESTLNDMARLQPDDIDSFSVLKDAAASAVYGARGANGVVVIRTKMGKAGKTRFHFRTETRVSSNTRNFQFADNITYMRLANEAALTRNPNAVLPYSQPKIERTAAGDNPLLYPSNNWIDQLISDYTVNQGINVSASGGGENARYYIAGTYNVDNGLLNVEGVNNFNNNIKLRNYSLRTNVDVNLTPTTVGIVRLYGQFDDYNGPIGGPDRYPPYGRVSGGAYIFNASVWSNPVAFPAVYPREYSPYIEHPLFGGARARNNADVLLLNPYAEMVKGYEVGKASTVQSQLEIKQDLGFVTPGLSARAMGYLRRYSAFRVSRQYDPFYYESRISPETGELTINVLNDGGPNSIGIPGQEFLDYRESGKDLDSRIYLETAINYGRTFNEKHAVSGMLINLLSSFERGNSGDVQSSLPSRNHGLSGRFTYGYDSKYLAEFNFGYNGSERFASGSRYGFFPSFGLAYRISEEKFWEPLKDVVTNLKLRGTYGLVGNDQIGRVEDRFFYLSNVSLSNGAYGATFGEQLDNTRPGVFIARYANPNIGWEESEQINLAVDLELYKSLNLTVDFFRQRRDNILQDRSNIGAVLGLTAKPATNFGEAESKGVDISLNYNKQLGQNWYAQFRGNLTYATNEVLEYDEINYPEELSYRSQIGQNVNQVYGYIAERLFVDDVEAENSPQQLGEYGGGDIKYRDVNGDGLITENDMVPIGYPEVPEIVYGFGGTIGYKAFDLSIFLQGAARTSFYIDPKRISPFIIEGRYQNGLLKAVADDYWSESNRNSYAFWPRLSDNLVENNTVQSTWWMRNGSFLRLKTVEAGYNLNRSLTDKLGIKSARLYFSGNNLAVWSSFKLWDPEMGGNGLGYPIQSVYNLGLRLDF